MKRFLVALLFVTLVSTSVFAATAIDSGEILVFGKISDGSVEFDVTSVSTIENKVLVDLINTQAVRSNGLGVHIGSWTFAATQQVADDTYTIAYSWNDLAVSGDTENVIEYELLEVDESVEPDETVFKNDVAGKTTTLTMTAGANNEVRKILFRLTATGQAAADIAPPSTAYESTITIALSSN